MKIQVRRRGDVEIFDFEGPLTRLEVGDLRRRFTESVKNGTRCFVFNLLQVPYVDSGAIGEMVACFKRARDHGGALKLLTTGGGHVEEVLRLASLERVLELFHDEGEAIVSFAG